MYLEFLGDHPFTATLMDDLGTSYQALENYGSAIEFLRKALHIRKHSLGNHQVTARSFYDFGKVNIYIYIYIYIYLFVCVLQNFIPFSEFFSLIEPLQKLQGCKYWISRLQSHDSLSLH